MQVTVRKQTDIILSNLIDVQNPFYKNDNMRFIVQGIPRWAGDRLLVLALGFQTGIFWPFLSNLELSLI